MGFPGTHRPLGGSGGGRPAGPWRDDYRQARAEGYAMPTERLWPTRSKTTISTDRLVSDRSQ